MKLLLPLLLAPVLSLAAATGSVTLLDGTPVSGAVIKSLTDSVTTSATGTFALGRTSGISPRFAKTVPVTSHLTVENGRPRLTFAGMDIAGRALNGVRYERTPGVAQAQSLKGAIGTRSTFSARSTGTPDTLKVYWKGKRLTVLPVTSDTTVTFRIDTAWKDDAGIPWNPSITYGSLFDSRDGQTYRTVTIGSQTWMAENLNFRVTDSDWYNSNQDSGKKYGRLYPWTAAMNLPDSCYRTKCISVSEPHSQGICPTEWSVPASAAWDTLISYAGGIEFAGHSLRSSLGWKLSGNGTDRFGFRVLAGGYRTETRYDISASGYAGFWSSTETDSVTGGFKSSYYLNQFFSGDTYEKRYGFSLRCLKD